MIKNFLYLIVLTAVIFSAAGLPSYAADTYINMIGGVGAGYNYLYPKDSQVKDFYKGGMTYKAFLGVKAENGLEVLGDVSYYSEGNMSSTAPYGTALTIIPITASVAYHFFNGASITPYLGGGVGIYNLNEKDPDYTYFQATKFGKHIFAGMDFYFDRGTLLRAELRQVFIDPVSNSLYYQANFGGLTATVNLAIEWPFGGGKSATPEYAAPQKASFSDDEYNAILDHLNSSDSYYYQRHWDYMYQPWNSPSVYVNVQPVQPVQPSQMQIDEQNNKAQQNKLEQNQKRQDYLNQKLELRQEKKETVNPSR